MCGEAGDHRSHASLSKPLPLIRHSHRLLESCQTLSLSFQTSHLIHVETHRPLNLTLVEYQSHPTDYQGPNSPITNPASFNGRSRDHRTAGAGRRAPSRDTRSGGHERQHLLPPKSAIREPQSVQPLQRMSIQITRTSLPTSCTHNLDLPKTDQTRNDYSDNLSTEDHRELFTLTGGIEWILGRVCSCLVYI